LNNSTIAKPFSITPTPMNISTVIFTPVTNNLIQYSANTDIKLLDFANNIKRKLFQIRFIHFIIWCIRVNEIINHVLNSTAQTRKGIITVCFTILRRRATMGLNKEEARNARPGSVF